MNEGSESLTLYCRTLKAHILHPQMINMFDFNMITLSILTPNIWLKSVFESVILLCWPTIMFHFSAWNPFVWLVQVFCLLTCELPCFSHLPFLCFAMWASMYDWLLSLHGVSDFNNMPFLADKVMSLPNMQASFHVCLVMKYFYL